MDTWGRRLAYAAVLVYVALAAVFVLDGRRERREPVQQDVGGFSAECFTAAKSSCVGVPAKEQSK